jgi:hypothetical protein
VCSHCPRTGNRCAPTSRPRAYYHLHRRPSSDPKNGFGRAWPWPEVRAWAGKHIAAIRRRRLGVTIELRLCPVHKGVPENEKAHEWAELAADEPDAHSVEHLRPGWYCDQPGQRWQPPRSLAHLKRSITVDRSKDVAESKATGRNTNTANFGNHARSPTRAEQTPTSGSL